MYLTINSIIFYIKNNILKLSIRLSQITVEIDKRSQGLITWHTFTLPFIPKQDYITLSGY